MLDNWGANLQAEEDSAVANTPAMNAGSTAGIAADSGPTCTGLRRQLADLEEMVHGFEPIVSSSAISRPKRGPKAGLLP